MERRCDIVHGGQDVMECRGCMIHQLRGLHCTVEYTIKGSVSALCIEIAVAETFESKWRHLLKC